MIEKYKSMNKEELITLAKRKKINVKTSYSKYEIISFLVSNQINQKIHYK
jgi:hypothetical protein